MLISAAGRLWECVIAVHKSFELKPFPSTNEKLSGNEYSLHIFEMNSAFKVHEHVFYIEVDTSGYLV